MGVNVGGGGIIGMADNFLQIFRGKTFLAARGGDSKTCGCPQLKDFFPPLDFATVAEFIM